MVLVMLPASDVAIWRCGNVAADSVAYDNCRSMAGLSLVVAMMWDVFAFYHLK